MAGHPRSKYEILRGRGGGRIISNKMHKPTISEGHSDLRVNGEIRIGGSAKGLLAEL